jgi:primary-amine oxidase
VPSGNGLWRGGRDESFTHGDLWVTRYRAEEFPFSSADQRPLKTALPAYLNDERVDGEDVVVWYVLHLHHLPRTEEYPAMPMEWVGFQLLPRDFLDRCPLSPRLD